MGRCGVLWGKVVDFGGKWGAEWGEVGNGLGPPRVDSRQGKGGGVLFVGAHERQLDDKGRLALPAAFRDRIAGHCYLAKGPDKSVTVVPAATFEAEAASMLERVQRGEVSRNELRALAASAVMVTLDKQGRVNLDEGLRDYADLPTPGPVMVQGSFDRLEIWTLDRYHAVNDAGTEARAGEGAR